MALVSMPPSPHTIGSMANRRVPLSSVPNAGNSPFRAVALAASKRSRLQSICSEEKRYDVPPPAKKQIVEINPSVPRTPPPRKQPHSTEGRVFNKRPHDSQLTAFDRKLLAVKDRIIDAKVTKIERVSDEPMDTLRQWQNHYKKAFPSFVFYFESVPEDSRRQYSKQLHIFGAVSSMFSLQATIWPLTNTTSRGRRSSFPKRSLILSLPGLPLSKVLLRHPPTIHKRRHYQ